MRHFVGSKPSFTYKFRCYVGTLFYVASQSYPTQKHTFLLEANYVTLCVVYYIAQHKMHNALHCALYCIMHNVGFSVLRSGFTFWFYILVLRFVLH